MTDKKKVVLAIITSSLITGIIGFFIGKSLTPKPHNKMYDLESQMIRHQYLMKKHQKMMQRHYQLMIENSYSY